MVTDIDLCIARVLSDVEAELAAARTCHPPLNSSHEAYAVILEEVEEYWEEVRKKRASQDRAKMRAELTQVAAMAIRAIVDLGI